MIEFFLGIAGGLLIYHFANELSIGNIPFKRKRNSGGCTIEKKEAPAYRYNACMKIDLEGYTAQINTNTRDIIGFVK